MIKCVFWPELLKFVLFLRGSENKNNLQVENLVDFFLTVTSWGYYRLLLLFWNDCTVSK